MINKIKIDIPEEAYENLKGDIKKMNKELKTTKLNWLINDLGLNELNAWLWIAGGAALTAAVLVLLSEGGAEIFRYWRVVGLNL
jgi:hypothetical protein